MNADSTASPISFIALSRIAEKQAAADPKCRRDWERRGKPLFSHVRALTDDALVEKLRQVGIPLDKNSYAEIAEHALSAEEIARTAVTDEVRARFRGPFDEDWVWLALAVLWERWFPQWPNFEQLDDQIQAGYALLKNNTPDTCERWLAAWRDFLLMFDLGSFKTLAEFDGAFRGTQCVFNWANDLEMELGNAANRDAKWHERRIQFCEDFLRRFPDEDQLTRENMRRALAEATFGAGDPAHGDALCEQWLKADPQWGWGWIGWADNYSLFATGSNRDEARAEALLKQGLSVPGVRDRDEILERLANLCAQQERHEEAKALQAESKKVRAAATAASERSLFLKEGFDSGEAGILLDQLIPVAEAARQENKQMPASVTPAVSRKIGRNDPCPCGSGKKYKKCCLSKDEAAARQAYQATRETPPARKDEDPIQTAPVLDSPGFLPSWNDEAPDEGALPPETKRQLDELWTAFEALSKPTSEQMNTLLSRLLELPAEATDWSDLFHRFARAGHPELPAVFRRIAGNVAHTKEAGLAFYYWGAAEELTHRGHRQLLPEVAAGFCKLDIESYDADALWHLLDWLLAEGFEAETLALAEHFLPILRADDDLMGYTVPDTCNLIFELRVGAHLRDDKNHDLEVNRLAEELLRLVEEDIHLDVARDAAAEIAKRSSATAWSRAEFELVSGDIKAGTKAWEDCLRLFRALIQVAREAWRFEQRSPDCALRGLTLMLNSVYDAQDSGGKKRKKASQNLLDHLLPAGLESRLVRFCRDIIGVNEPRARLIIDAHDVLLRFAARHQLLSEPDLARSRREIDRLKRQLDGVDGD